MNPRTKLIALVLVSVACARTPFPNTEAASPSAVAPAAPKTAGNAAINPMPDMSMDGGMDSSMPMAGMGKMPTSRGMDGGMDGSMPMASMGKMPSRGMDGGMDASMPMGGMGKMGTSGCCGRPMPPPRMPPAMPPPKMEGEHGM